MRSIRRAVKRCAAAMALAGAALASSLAADREVIIGYGPLNFGMTVTEALRAAPKARLMRCNFPSHFRNCVDYDEKAYGHDATVRARFDDDQKLNAIYVQFDRLDGAAGSRTCRKTATELLEALRKDYGPNWVAKSVSAAAQARATPPATAEKQEAPKGAKSSPSNSAQESGAAAATNRWPEPPVWYGTRGGKIGLVDLCAGDDTGVVYIVVTPSSIPGRRAS